jgi:hypothetical protein
MTPGSQSGSMTFLSNYGKEMRYLLIVKPAVCWKNVELDVPYHIKNNLEL